VSDKLKAAKVKTEPATKITAETYLRAKGHAKGKVDAAKAKALAPMVCEVHGVSDAEYSAAKRKS
jgi:hypothetical protein